MKCKTCNKIIDQSKQYVALDYDVYAHVSCAIKQKSRGDVK